MAAYAIGCLQVRDTSWRKEYGPKVHALVKKHGGRYLVAGNRMEVLEGNPPLPSSMVVLEFPSMEAARAWYNDPDYRPMIELRQSGSDLDFVLVDGLPA